MAHSEYLLNLHFHKILILVQSDTYFFLKMQFQRFPLFYTSSRGPQNDQNIQCISLALSYSRQDVHKLYTKPSLFTRELQVCLVLSTYSNVMVHALLDRERALVGFEAMQQHYNGNMDVLNHTPPVLWQQGCTKSYPTLCSSQAVFAGHTTSYLPWTIVAGMCRILSIFSNKCSFFLKKPPFTK